MYALGSVLLIDAPGNPEIPPHFNNAKGTLHHKLGNGKYIVSIRDENNYICYFPLAKEEFVLVKKEEYPELFV